MRKTLIKSFLVGSFLALAIAGQGLAQSAGGRPPDACESAALKAKVDTLLELMILARAEERAEELRLKLFDLEIQEMGLQARIEDLDYRLTPDSIQRALALVGSARPMDELREGLRLRLENEKARVSRQLELLTSNRARLESLIDRADQEVERLRKRLRPME